MMKHDNISNKTAEQQHAVIEPIVCRLTCIFLPLFLPLTPFPPLSLPLLSLCCPREMMSDKSKRESHSDNDHVTEQRFAQQGADTAPPDNTTTHHFQQNGLSDNHDRHQSV